MQIIGSVTNLLRRKLCDLIITVTDLNQQQILKGADLGYYETVMKNDSISL